MRLTVDRAKLQDALGWLHQVVGDRVPLPHVGYVRLSTEGESVALEGANFERGGQATVPAQVEQGGAVIVNLRRLHRACSVGDVVTIEHDGAHHVAVSSQGGSFSLSAMADPPPELHSDAAHVATVDGGELAWALRAAQTACGASYDFAKVVRIHTAGDVVGVGATDDLRVHMATAEADVVGESQALVATRDVAVLVSTVKGRQVRLSLGESEVSVDAEDRRLVLRTLHIPYRPLEQVLGAATDHEAVVEDPQGLAEAAQVASSFDSREMRQQVVLRPVDGALSVGAGGDGEQADMSVPAHTEEGPQARVAGAMLSDALKQCRGEATVGVGERMVRVWDGPFLAVVNVARG